MLDSRKCLLRGITLSMSVSQFEVEEPSQQIAVFRIVHPVQVVRKFLRDTETTIDATK